MDYLAAIRQRVSTRSYDNRSVDSAILERLLSFAANAGHLSDAPPRVELVSGVDAVKDVLTFVIGSYGFVLGAPHVLVGVLPGESERARVDLGYVLEQVVLEATRLGLGTCWITGTYDPERTADTVKLEPGEVAAGVCALGYPTETGLGHLHSRVVRRLARGHRRKPLTEIVFSERWGKPWSPEGADPILVSILEHARLAPSASNLQPWRFVVDGNRVTLTMMRRSPIDAGIVMSHITVAAAALERTGHWELRLRDDDLRERYNLPGKVMPVGVFTYSDS
jgi:nitroreductase